MQRHEPPWRPNETLLPTGGNSARQRLSFCVQSARSQAPIHYDTNIRASLHDVAPPERRATAVGVMNAIGWLTRRRAWRG